MAGTVKLDIEEETMIRLGVENYDSTRAIRSFIVDMEGEDEENYRSQLEAGVIDLKAALLAENNNETYDHPDDWDLDPFHAVGDSVDTEQTGQYDSRNPLQSITARNFGNSVIGTVEYGRSKFSPSPYYPFHMAEENAFPAGKKKTYEISAYKGLLSNYEHAPQGWPTAGWGPAKKTRNISYSRTQINTRDVLIQHPRVFIETTLAERSDSGIGKVDFATLRSSVNSKPIRINGVVRPAHSIRFNDIEVTPFWSHGVPEADDISGASVSSAGKPGDAQVKYVVSYEFIEDPYLWSGTRLFVALVRCHDLIPLPRTCIGVGTGSSTLMYNWERTETKLTPIDYTGLFPVSIAERIGVLGEEPGQKVAGY